MKGSRRKQPFVINRQNKKNTELLNKRTHMESSSNALVPVSKRNAQIEEANQILAQKTSFKNMYNMFNISADLMPELLQKYAKDNMAYRQDGFTQQADRFLSKIANSKKIPKELRTNYKLFEILVSISKIFMLNEYEIVVLGCALDHCGWKIQETVYAEEAELLQEFPGNLGEDISTECKRLVIYLLVITFSLKQYLNEKVISDRIHAYCESICHNFQAIFNRWTRLSLHQKFNYSPVEINRKFRMFCEPEVVEFQAANTDYNNVVEEIMGMSGSYKSKINTIPVPNVNTIEIIETQAQEETFKPIQSIFNKPMPTPSIKFPPIADNKHIFANLPIISMPSISIDRKGSMPKFPEMNIEDLPEVLENVSRRSSSNKFLEELSKKKLRLNNGVSGMTTMNRESSFSKDFSFFLSNNIFKPNPEAEDPLFNFGFPTLSKKSSHNMSQIFEEQPDMLRFKSNMSSWYKE